MYSLLICPEKEKNYYLSMIKNSMDPKTEPCDYASVVKKLGTPEEWVMTRLDFSDPKWQARVLRKVRNQKRALMAIGIGAFCAIVLYVLGRFFMGIF